METEYLDIVNEHDKVIGKATRHEIYEKKHTHRIVHVLVFNGKEEIALHKRSVNNTFCPGYFGTSV